MFKHALACCLLVLALLQVQAQVVQIIPEKPERGDKVTIIYHPGAPGAAIGPDATEVLINFTYSTFYELPWKLPMTRQGKDWVASFVLQRYATFATFYLQNGERGELIDKPAADRHYSIAVYKGDKRVRDGFLHESYSLGAQMPKSPRIPALQLELLRKELANYPDNYEAKVREQSVLMAMAKSPAEKLKHRNEARKIIAAQFEKNPTFGGNLNKVTMGYLIIGENSRLDSIRKVVSTRFPESDLAKDYLISAIGKEKDTLKKINQLEALLKKGNETGENSTDIHRMLFDYYTGKGDAGKSVYHARRSLGPLNPYTPQQLKVIAEEMTKARIAPDTAIAYAEAALKIADQWPIGVIRYFPEYGHILPYVADSTRKKTVAEARSSLYSIIALNKLYTGNKPAAFEHLDKAAATGANKESLMNIAAVYAQTANPQKAFEAVWSVLLKDPSDKQAIGVARKNFLAASGTEAEFNTRLKELEELKLAQLKQTLRKQLMNKPGPELAKLTDLKGKPVTPEMMKGKVVILDFWATWCIPCMQEMPYLQKVYDKYKHRPEVMFMVVNSGARNTIKDAIGWEAKNPQYTFPLYFNNDPEIGEKVGFTLIPTIAIIDQQGLMQFRTIGFEGAELEHKLAAQIDILLEAGKK
ncbi:TlpA family protein disulfide reductase [Pedobacter africanus]|uniref:Thiol-disulfide isomerase or thioredoxin n=1 Tax=Pedobacter africanus TaxID=151894 RepID=A0A1W2BNG6_9SPHI|nr:TlpA disulfide reductase family protein [Pedobacter africanus]SMC74447.1 Thiol-disulfide isomerase or thioredoxin [Pedobacter africanus]